MCSPQTLNPKPYALILHMGLTKIRGTLFGGPRNKDYNVLGSILGPPILGNCHIRSYRILPGENWGFVLPKSSLLYLMLGLGLRD